MEATILRRLYDEMLRICLVEEKIVALHPEQEVRCPVYLCIGSPILFRVMSSGGNCSA